MTLLTRCSALLKRSSIEIHSILFVTENSATVDTRKSTVNRVEIRSYLALVLPAKKRGRSSTDFGSVTCKRWTRVANQRPRSGHFSIFSRAPRNVTFVILSYFLGSPAQVTLSPVSTPISVKTEPNPSPISPLNQNAEEKRQSASNVTGSRIRIFWPNVTVVHHCDVGWWVVFWNCNRSTGGEVWGKVRLLAVCEV